MVHALRSTPAGGEAEPSASRHALCAKQRHTSLVHHHSSAHCCACHVADYYRLLDICKCTHVVPNRAILGTLVVPSQHARPGFLHHYEVGGELAAPQREACRAGGLQAIEPVPSLLARSDGMECPIIMLPEAGPGTTSTRKRFASTRRPCAQHPQAVRSAPTSLTPSPSDPFTQHPQA